MAIYSIFYMFENPRTCRQAQNLTTKISKILDLKSSSEQIFSENCRWVPLNFVDRHNSINLSLTRSKMAEPTYFLRNCALVFCWVFHRLCKNLRPFNVLYESLRNTLYAPLLFFSHNQIFLFGILLVSTWKTYFHKIFAMKTVFKAF